MLAYDMVTLMLTIQGNITENSLCMTDNLRKRQGCYYVENIYVTADDLIKS